MHMTPDAVLDKTPAWLGWAQDELRKRAGAPLASPVPTRSVPSPAELRGVGIKYIKRRKA
jgi:hypothetical protein